MKTLMKIDAVGAMNRLNPVFFYLGLLLHNYIIKSTNQNYLFIFTFFPSIIYVLIKSLILGIEDLFNFKCLYFGLLIGILDFSIIYIYSELMRTNSTFLCVSISIFPVIATLLPIASFQYLCTLYSTFLFLFPLRSLTNLEITGKLKYFEIIPIGGIFTKGDTVILFIFLLYLRTCIGWFCNRKSNNGRTLFTANMFYLSVISLIYGVCIEKVRTLKDGPNTIIFFSCYFYILFLLTLSSVGKQKHMYYFIIFGLINVLYFLQIGTTVFKTTRVEIGLRFPYFLMFVWLCIVTVYAVFWYLYKFKDLYQDYQNTRQTTIREFLINLEQGSLNDINELIRNQHRTDQY